MKKVNLNLVVKKVGWKWIHVVEIVKGGFEKKYKILVDENIKKMDLEVGSKIEETFRIEYKNSYRGRYERILYYTNEELEDKRKQEKRKKKIEKSFQLGQQWLGYIKENLNQYWYNNGEKVVKEKIDEINKEFNIRDSEEFTKKRKELASELEKELKELKEEYEAVKRDKEREERKKADARIRRKIENDNILREEQLENKEVNLRELILGDVVELKDNKYARIISSSEMVDDVDYGWMRKNIKRYELICGEEYNGILLEKEELETRQQELQTRKEKSIKEIREQISNNRELLTDEYDEDLYWKFRKSDNILRLDGAVFYEDDDKIIQMATPGYNWIFYKINLSMKDLAELKKKFEKIEKESI